MKNHRTNTCLTKTHILPWRFFIASRISPLIATHPEFSLWIQIE